MTEEEYDVKVKELFIKRDRLGEEWAAANAEIRALTEEYIAQNLEEIDR
jgi:hypothetical protein